MKIGDNVSIVTSKGITFNGEDFDGYKGYSEATKDTWTFSEASKNTVIISDAKENSLYVVGVEVSAKAEGEGYTYTYKTSDNASVQMVSKDGDMTYSYSADIDAGKAITGSSTIDNILNKANKETGNISVSKETEEGVTYSYSIAYKGDIGYKETEALNIKSVLKEAYDESTAKNKDEASVIMKIGDNVSIVTSKGITFNGEDFDGYKGYSEDTKETWTFSDASKNTAIIGDEAGNTLYISGVAVIGDGSQENPYGMKTVKGATIQISNEDGGYTYSYSGELKTEFTYNGTGEAPNIGTILGDTQKGSISVSYKAENGAIYSYSQDYNWEGEYDPTKKLNIKDVFVYDAKANGSASVMFEISEGVSVATSVGVSFNGSTGKFEYTDKTNSDVNIENVTIAQLFANSAENTVIINKPNGLKTYITGAKVIAANVGDETKYSVHYIDNSTIQDQISNTDTIIINNLSKDINGLEITANWKDTVFKTDVDDETKHLYVTDASISYSHKINDNVTVTTTNINIGDALNSEDIDLGKIFGDATKNTAIIKQNFGPGNDATLYVTSVEIWDKEKNTFADTFTSTSSSILYTYWDAESGKFANDTSTNIVALYLDASTFEFTGSFTGKDFKVECGILEDLAKNGKIETFFGSAEITNANNSPDAAIIYSNGAWICQNGATLKITDSEVDVETIKALAEKQGLEIITDISNFKFESFEGQQLTYIPGNAETALSYLLSIQEDNIKEQGINLVVSGEEYTTSSGITLEAGSAFNLGFNEKGLVVLRAGHTDGNGAFLFGDGQDCAGSYTLGQPWKAVKDGEEIDEKDFSESFKAGQYITAATLLKNAGIEGLIGENISWRGETYAKVTISIKEEKGECYFALMGDGSTVTVQQYNSKHELVDTEENSTGLTSEYNGIEFTILEGAKVNITDDGISIYDATIYTEGMIIGAKPDSSDGQQPSEQQQEENDPEKALQIDSTFKGLFVQNGDDTTSGTATGLFFHYSDDTIEQVFSMATILNKGSIYSPGSIVNGQEIKYETVMGEDGSLQLTDNGSYFWIADNLEKVAGDINLLALPGNHGTAYVDSENRLHFNGATYTIEDIKSGALDEVINGIFQDAVHEQIAKENKSEGYYLNRMTEAIMKVNPDLTYEQAKIEAERELLGVNTFIGELEQLTPDKLELVGTTKKGHKEAEQAVSTLNMYIDRYGEDTVLYMIYHWGTDAGEEVTCCGSAGAAANFLNYIASEKKISGDGASYTDALLREIYGVTDDGDCNICEFDAGVFQAIVKGAGIAYDSNRYATNSAPISAETVNFAEEMLDNAEKIAEEYCPTSPWTMNSMGDVNIYRSRIVLSDSPDIKSGIYSEVVRNDGSLTLTGFKTVEVEENGEKKQVIKFNSYGIDGTYEGFNLETGQMEDIHVQISPTITIDPHSGMASVDTTGKVGIYVHANAAISQTIEKKEDVSGGNSSDAEIDTRVKRLTYIDNPDNIIYIGTGADNFYSAIYNPNKTLSAQVYGNGAVYTEGVSIYGNRDNITFADIMEAEKQGSKIQGADIDFNSGYLKVQGGEFVASDRLAWEFRDEASFESYVKDYIMPNYEYAGLTLDTLIDRLGNELDFSFYEGKECNVNPFDYLAVMDDLHDEDNTTKGFGFRLKVDMGEDCAGIADVSGVADLKTSGVSTIDFYAEKIDHGDRGKLDNGEDIPLSGRYTYIEDFRVSGLSAEHAFVTTTLRNNIVQVSGEDITTTEVKEGDRISLGAVIYAHGNNGVTPTFTTYGATSFYGPNNQLIYLDNVLFTGDAAGHFILASDVLLNGQNGINYMNDGNQFVIKDIIGGSIVQLGMGNNLNVLYGSSHIYAVIDGHLSDINGGGAGSTIPSASIALFEGTINETLNEDDKKITEVDGFITGWKSSSMAQDFSADTIRRQGSRWTAGSYFDGHYTKAEAYDKNYATVNAEGRIDSKYYQKTTTEIVVGAVAAAAVVIVSAAAAFFTCGASLAVQITAACIAAAASAVLVAPSAFEHGAGIAYAIETGNYDSLVSNIVGLGLDLFSAYMIGTSAGKIAVDFALNGGIKALGRTIVTGLGWAGAGGVAGGIVGGCISVYNGGNFWDGAKVGALSGALIGFSTYFGAKTLGLNFHSATGILGKFGAITRFAMNTVLDSVILVKTSQSFVDNIAKQDIRSAASDLLILLSVGIINPISQYNNALKAQNLAAGQAGDSLFKRGQDNLSKGMVGGKPITNALFTGLSVGVAIPLMNVMGTIASNFMSGREIFEGIDLKGLAVQFAFGFALGFTVGMINPRLGYNWSVRNIWGTIGEVIYNPGNVILKGVTSGTDLMRFNILAPVLNAIVAPITGVFNNFINSGNEEYEGFDYGNLWKSWGSQFETIGEKYELMLFGDLKNEKGWAAVKNSFGTGFFQSHFFGMAIPGTAIINPKGLISKFSPKLANGLSRFFTIWGEGGVTSLPGGLIGGKFGNFLLSLNNSVLGSMITKPINMLQYGVAEKLFGSLGSWIDSKLEGSSFYNLLEEYGLASFKKGQDTQGLFEYILSSASMMLVPSAMKAESWSTQRDLAQMRADRRMGYDSTLGNRILNGEADLSLKNAAERDALINMAAKSVSDASLSRLFDFYNNKDIVKKGQDFEQITKEDLIKEQNKDALEGKIMAAVAGEMFSREILRTSDIEIINNNGVITIESGKGAITNSTLAKAVLQEAMKYDILNNNIDGVYRTRTIIEDLLKETITEIKNAEGKDTGTYQNTIFSKDLSSRGELFATFIQASNYIYNYCKNNSEEAARLGIDILAERNFVAISQIDPENAAIMKNLRKGYIKFNGEKIAVTQEFLESAIKQLTHYASLTGQDSIINKVMSGLKIASTGKNINGEYRTILQSSIDNLSMAQEQTQKTNINQLIQKFFDKNNEFGITDKNSLDSSIKDGKYVKMLESLQKEFAGRWDEFFVLSKYICDKTIENMDEATKEAIMLKAGIDKSGKLGKGLFRDKLDSYINNIMESDDRAERKTKATEEKLFGFFACGEKGTLVNMYMLGKIQLDAAFNNLNNVSSDKNLAKDALYILADASLNYTMGCLFLKEYTMSSYQYNAILNAANAMIEGNKGTRKFVPVATGEGKTTIIAALMPVVKATNDILGKRTILLADNGINVQNIFKECLEFYGTINEAGELVSGLTDAAGKKINGACYNMEVFDYKNGTKSGKDTILFMTYSDLAFQYVADKNLGNASILKGKMGYLLMDEADMTLYLPKAMISEWSGSETNRKIVRFFDELVNKNSSKNRALQDLLNNPNENKLSFMQKLSLYKSAFTDAFGKEGGFISNFRDNIKEINSIVSDIQKMGLIQYLVMGGGEPNDAAKARWAEYVAAVEVSQKLSNMNENTTFSKAEVDSMMLSFTSLKEMISKQKDIDEAKVAEIKTEISDFFKQNADGSWSLLDTKDVSLQKILMDQSSLYENMYIRTSVDANPNVMKVAGMMLANNSEFKGDRSLFKYIQDDTGIIYKGYSLDSILKNSLTTMLTWKDGIDYGVQDGSVMLIQQGKYQALMPEAGLLQTAEALARADGKDVKITRISPRDSSSAAIMDAVRDAYGAIGLSGTYSKAARSAMGFEELNIGSRFSELNSPDGAKDRVVKGTGWVDVDYLNPARTKLEAYNEVIIGMLTKDKGLIVGLPDQASLDLLRNYISVVGIGKITAAQTVYYDSSISAELAERKAGSKDYRYHIGIYEQVGRGLNIKMDKGVTSIDAIAIDAHLSYKSAVEQFMGRVLGNRHTNSEKVGTGAIANITDEYGTREVYENIHIKFISDNRSILAMSQNANIISSGYLSSINLGTYTSSASDYAQLVYSMVIAGGGARAEMVEINKSGALSGNVVYNTANITTTQQLMNAVSTIIMNNTSTKMTSDAAYAEAQKVIQPILTDGRFYNGRTLTSEGAQAATQLVQYFRNTPSNIRTNGYTLVDNILNLSGASVSPSAERFAGNKGSVPIVKEINVMAENICELYSKDLIQLNPYTQNNLSKLMSVGSVVTASTPAGKVQDVSMLARLQNIMRSDSGIISVIENRNINPQVIPATVKTFNRYAQAVDTRTKLFAQRREILNSDNSTLVKAVQTIPTIFTQLFNGMAIKSSGKQLDALKQDIFVDVMSNSNKYTNMEHLLLTSGYTTNGFNFTPWQTIESLKNISSITAGSNIAIDWSKTDRAKVISYATAGDMKGLSRYLGRVNAIDVKDIPAIASLNANASAPAVATSQSATSRPTTSVENIVSGAQTGKYDIGTNEAKVISDAAKAYVSSKAAGQSAKRPAISVKAVEAQYFLTDAQLAKLADMSTTEIITYMRYNLAAQAVADVLNDSMRLAVRAEMIKDKTGEELTIALQDYDNLIAIIDGKVVTDANGNILTIENISAKYNLSVDTIDDTTRDVVYQQMLDSLEGKQDRKNSDYAELEDDYAKLILLASGETISIEQLRTILTEVKGSMKSEDYDKYERILAGEEVLDNSGEKLTVANVADGIKAVIKTKYNLGTAVPFAVEALAGFRDGQKEAFRDILQATIENGQEGEKSAGYAQELQTAGGKSLIGLFSVLLLSANPNIEGRDNKFITWLTNEDSNAEDLYNHINFVFGNSLGNIEVISQANVKQWQEDGTLRQRLDNAGVVIGTYSSWGSLFSETMAGLLSYGPDETRQEVKDQVDHNRKILEGAGIKLDQTILSDGETVKVQFKNAKDSAKAIQILLANGQGLDRVNLPIDRISQLVGDELDYAATIPASALASAAGKYTKEYGMVEYYQKILDGAEIEASDYAYLGIDEERLNADQEILTQENGRQQLEKRRDAYRTISAAITKAYESASVEDKNDVEAIKAIVLENKDVQGAKTILGISEQQIKDITADQYSSIRNLEVRTRLLGLNGGSLTVEIDGLTIDIAQMSKFTEGDKGSKKIKFGDGTDESVRKATIKTVAAETKQAGYTETMINNIRDILLGMMKKHVGEDVDAKTEEQKPVITQEQYNKALEEMIDKIYAEYGDVFHSKTEVREFLVTGMDALSLYTAKEGNVGTGAYMVDRDKNGKAQNVYITNNGTPMKSLNMPGMWTIELMEGCDSINKPSLETFISSKEALAAFEWSIGFSGTFSSSIRTLLKDLDYAKIGGSMPDTMKVGVTTALTQTQEEMATVIAQARQKLNADGIAGVDLIMTANSDGTTQMVEQLQKNGIKEDDIVSLSLDLLDRELTKLSDTKKYPSAKVAEVMKSAGVEDYSVNDLAKIDMNVKIKVLQEVLKNVMKKGEVSFIVGDVSLLGRGWNPGKMDGAIDNLKAKQNIKGDAKVQATMWKVNFEKMDATQSEQGDGRFAHRDGTSRFSSEFYNRDIIQITSVDSVRENKILREAAKKEGGYSVEMILNNLNDVMEANEESTLQKANNAVVNQTKQWAKAQDAKGNVAPTYGQAKAKLVEQLGEDAAKGIMDKVLEIARVRTGADDETMTREGWFAYENYERYVAASEAMSVKPNGDAKNERVQKVMRGDVLAALELIKETDPEVSIDKLIGTVRDINEKYSIQQGKVAAIYEGLSEQDKATIAGLGKKDIGILGKIGGSLKAIFSSDIRALMKENKKLNSYETEFTKAKDALKGKINGDIGIVFDRNLGKVSFAVQDGIKKAEEKTESAETTIEYPFKDIVEKVTEKVKGNFDSEVIEAAVSNCAIVVLSSLGGVDVERMATFIANKLDATTAEDTEREIRYSTVIEELQVAGDDSAISITIGEMIKELGVTIPKMRVAYAEDITEVTVPKKGMVALLGTSHVVQITNINKESNEIEYAEFNKETKEVEVKVVSEDKFREMGFEGIVMLPANSMKNNGISKVTATMKDICDALGIDRKAIVGEDNQIIRNILSAVINGVTKPQELKDTVEAALAIYSNSNEMAQAIGFNSIEEVKNASKQDIIDMYTKQVTTILNMDDVSSGDMQASIEILAAVRDMLIMVNNNNSLIALLDSQDTNISDILKELVISKAVNQNVVVSTVKDSVAKLKVEDENFEIDITKLQKVVKEKVSFTKEELLKDLGALLADGRGAAKNKMPVSLMKLADIRAIAAAA